MNEQTDGMSRQMDGQTDGMSRQVDEQTDERANRWMCRQMDVQTDGHYQYNPELLIAIRSKIAQYMLYM